jgi:hypothetical protein
VGQSDGTQIRTYINHVIIKVPMNDVIASPDQEDRGPIVDFNKMEFLE